MGDDGEMLQPPVAAPCAECPYRQDVPSGMWSTADYLKLPLYDGETAYQPTRPFRCHKEPTRVCAGWAGCHDGQHLLALRMAVPRGVMTLEDMLATRNYRTDVPLWPSGAAAAVHGLGGVYEPGEEARAAIERYQRRQRSEASARSRARRGARERGEPPAGQ